MPTVLELITKGMPWTFKSLGIENEVSGVLEESILFPIDSKVYMKNADFPPRNNMPLIGKKYNIYNNYNDNYNKIIKITYALCIMKNILNGGCKLHVKEVKNYKPTQTAGGSRSKSRKNRKTRKMKQSIKKSKSKRKF